jgi:AraC-like DNA-binding protein
VAGDEDPALAALANVLATSRVDAIAVSTAAAVPSPRAVSRLVRAGIVEVFHAPTAVKLAEPTTWVLEHRPRALPLDVWHGIVAYVPTSAETLFRRTLRLAHAPITVGALAESCGCSERQLLRLCQAAGLPGSLWLIAMARLATAGYLLERTGMTLPDVVHYLGYESPEQLRLKCLKWTGCSPRQLLAGGWTARVGQLIAGRTDMSQQQPGRVGHSG